MVAVPPPPVEALQAKLWLRLSMPHAGAEEGVRHLVGAALDSPCPVDVSTMPALWGGYLRSTHHPLCVVGSALRHGAVDASHAADLVQAELIQNLVALGQETLAVYLLHIAPGTIDSARHGLKALFAAREEGHLGHVGVSGGWPDLRALARESFPLNFVLCSEGAASAEVEDLSELSLRGVRVVQDLGSGGVRAAGVDVVRVNVSDPGQVGAQIALWDGTA